MKYIVRTRDVDCSTRRQYATLAGARKRFEEMVGYSCENAIAEDYWKLAEEGKPLPTLEEVRALRAVSPFGTVVVLEKRED